jgi:hypothetical protein
VRTGLFYFPPFYPERIAAFGDKSIPAGSATTALHSVFLAE